MLNCFSEGVNYSPHSVVANPSQIKCMYTLWAVAPTIVKLTNFAIPFSSDGSLKSPLNQPNLAWCYRNSVTFVPILGSGHVKAITCLPFTAPPVIFVNIIYGY